MFSLIFARINGWAINREAGDLRRHHAHYDVNCNVGNTMRRPWYPVRCGTHIIYIKRWFRENTFALCLWWKCGLHQDENTQNSIFRWVSVQILNNIPQSLLLLPFGLYLYSVTPKHPWWRHQMETFSALLAIVREIHRSPVNFPHKGQWRGALMFALICVLINGWVNNRKAGDLRRYRAHYGVIVMSH